MVLCHNDGQENNILVHSEDNERLILIDFEYGGFNPIGYDLANYWNECICDN
jgi:thiamine kinase-like enzyme